VRTRATPSRSCPSSPSPSSTCKPDVIADRFPTATILFADIVGFTVLSAGVSPETLVAMLNEIFTEFDALAERYDIEKIKTIGDAYMVVGGLPTPRDDHVEAVCNMALDMLAVLEKRRERTGQALNIRIGVHTGPVVAGVIGRRKFSYDLWGDSVNTASRLESHGGAGAVQVSDAVRDAVCTKFAFEERGVITLKGKGEMRTHWLRERMPLR
jgi:class 3 adenylate cyclase